MKHQKNNICKCGHYFNGHYWRSSESEDLWCEQHYADGCKKYVTDNLAYLEKLYEEKISK